MIRWLLALLRRRRPPVCTITSVRALPSARILTVTAVPRAPWASILSATALAAPRALILTVSPV